jgi:hypothetical protein
VGETNTRESRAANDQIHGSGSVANSDHQKFSSMQSGHSILKFSSVICNQTSENVGQRLVVAHVIGHAIFVAILVLAFIVGLGNIFWDSR